MLPRSKILKTDAARGQEIGAGDIALVVAVEDESWEIEAAAHGVFCEEAERLFG